MVANEINLKMQKKPLGLKKQPDDPRVKLPSIIFVQIYNKQQIISHWTGSLITSHSRQTRPDCRTLRPTASISLTNPCSSVASQSLKQTSCRKLTSEIQSFQKQASMILKGFHAPNYRILKPRILTLRHPPITNEVAPLIEC